MSKNYNAVVNEDFQFEGISGTDLDVIPLDDKHFHILQNGKSFRAELISIDAQQKQVQLKINGNKYHIQLEDQYDQLIRKMGLKVKTNQQIKDIKAPMPGLVLEIMVEVGQFVAVGDALLILQAMKMENVIKAQGEGVIKDIVVKQGAAVEKGQLLIVLE
jgi:biotin carboxyl carrier protein